MPDKQAQKAEQMTAEQPARRRGPAFPRQLPARRPSWEWLMLVLIAAALILAGLACFDIQTARQAAGRPAGATLIGPEQAGELVERGSRLIGLGQPPSIWSERLASGQADPADYLMRLFTSPAYLAKNADDAIFISDAAWVIDGQAMNAEEQTAGEEALLSSGSRLVYLNQLVAAKNWAGGIRLPAQTTRLRTYRQLADLPEPESEIVGLLPISCEARLSGQNARIRMFVDGQLRLVRKVDTPDPSVQHVYSVTWDTRDEQPGGHAPSLLLLTNDGRGQWVDLPAYHIPRVFPLEPLQIELPASRAAGTSVWYELPVQDGQALILLPATSGTLELKMFDLDGQTIAATVSTGGQPAALRHRFAGKPPETVFVQASLTSAENWPADCMLLASLAAARPLTAPADILPVLAMREDELQIRDTSGKTSWRPREDYELIDPTALLARLSLRLPDGREVDLAPAFDPQIEEYGLYLAGGSGFLDLSVLAAEGSAAELTITYASDLLAEADKTQAIQADASLQPVPAESSLHLSVTGFDGTIRQYVIHILQAFAGEGYHRALEPFPASYRSALYLQHVRHPSWQFIADATGLDWPAFIAAQDEGGLNLANAGASPASWIEPGSPVYDGSSWKAVTAQVIAYFADPRNFLDEGNIFQFEKLDYLPAVHGLDGINAILQDTFMAEGNEQGLDYAAMLLQAGREANISPFFLASKIIQEMGRQGQSPLATGTLAGYEGAYNFYNIGATPDPEITNGAQINGARFALFGWDADQAEITPEEAVWLLPWLTPQRAISGGARWIAERYVQIGQDTLYLQKFDLIAEDGLYIHQYAQNIQMAWAEGRRTYRAYEQTGLLDQPFVFRLPVFLDMPAVPVALP